MSEHARQKLLESLKNTISLSLLLAISLSPSVKAYTKAWISVVEGDASASSCVPKCQTSLVLSLGFIFKYNSLPLSLIRAFISFYYTTYSSMHTHTPRSSGVSYPLACQILLSPFIKMLGRIVTFN